MTLRRKMFLQIVATIMGLLLTIAASLWGINGLRADYGIALNGYNDLRRVFEAGSHLATARTLLTQPAADRAGALREVRTAEGMFQMMHPAAEHGGERAGESRNNVEGEQPDAAMRLSAAGKVNQAVEQAAVQLARPEGDEADLESMNQALGRVGDLAAEIRQRIQASQEAARAKRHDTVAAMLTVFVLVVIGTLVLGIWEYRGVLGPLARLSAGVKRVALGRFSQRVEVRGSDEFAMLAGDFNRMAEELDGLYQNLERKVAEKSRELVRSERLASVGYLAAGVAHEINNPLGIISGYAEMALEQLRQPTANNGESASDSGGSDELSKSLRIICDEAFRCKQIIAKLLSLSRAGDEARSEVDLAEVVRQVIGMIGGLPDYRMRRIEWEGGGTKGQRDRGTEGGEGRQAGTKGQRDKGTKGEEQRGEGTKGEEGERFVVMANEVEMKQVVLNLLINALEASPVDGVVRVELSGESVLEVPDRDERKALAQVELQAGSPHHNVVRLAVVDHGKGMSPETAQRVFEPFFTEKKGTPHNGTGLGLSITHAIVTSHGGRICAESEGPGKGSRFSVELPAAAKTGELS